MSDEPPQPSLAASASQRVGAIIEAAEASADAIRRDAEAEAEAIRVRARAHAPRASSSIDPTLQRLEELHRELGALIGSLRAEAAVPPAAAAPAPGSAPDAPVASCAPAPGEDGAGIRLIALDMALGGTPREQTARFLAEHYALEDPERLLDEVYASAGR